MAKPTIVAAPNRGNYSVKGTPKGITIPKAPVAGSVVKGAQGVDFVYRPGGAQGAGYYKKPKPTPSITGSKPITGFKPTTGTDASGATIAAVPPATAPVASTTPFNWGNAYTSNAQYQSTAPTLAAGQNQIGESYGLTMRRDTNSTSPTYGQPIYRLPTEKAGEGTVIASMGPGGEFVWKDASGNPVDVKDLKIDYVPVASGQEGYLQGALGNAAATSANTQQSIANTAAQVGARRSGMRAQGSLAETGNLQGAQARLTQGAMGEYGANLGKWAELYKSIYGELLPNAADMAPAPEVPEAPVAPVIPDAAAPNTNPNTQTGLVDRQALSGGPNGQFMGQAGAIVAQRDAPYSQIKTSLLGLKRFALTAQQIEWIDNWIKNNAPKPDKGKGKGK